MTAAATQTHRPGKVFSIVIASGDTASGVLDLRSKTQRLFTFLIQSPGTLTGTVTAQVSLDGTNFVNLQSAGSDVTIGASKGVVIIQVPACYFRFNSGSAEGADRTFQVVADGFSSSF